MCHRIKPCARIDEQQAAEEYLARRDFMAPHVREMIATAGDDPTDALNLSAIGMDIRNTYGLWQRYGDDAMYVSRRILREVCRRLR